MSGDVNEMLEEKLMKTSTWKLFLLGMAGTLLLLAVIVPVTLGIVHRDQRARSRLFNNRRLTETEEEPVIRTPYTVCTLENDGTWAYPGNVLNTVLRYGEGITERVQDSRTCIFIWAAPEEREVSRDFAWENDEEIWFAPVYMTVIDREEKIRYADIRIGITPMVDEKTYSPRYPLYSPENPWNTFDMDAWYYEHLEKGSLPASSE